MCKQVDPDEINKFYKNFVVAEDMNMSEHHKITPFGDTNLKSKPSLAEEEKAVFHKTGMQMIKDGKVCVVVLAGGQGTRLGFNHPKGCFGLPGLPGPESRTIFQLLVERFYRIQMSASGHGILKEDEKLPLDDLKCKMLIMTSNENHDETIYHFKKNKWFGGSEKNFEFFP